MADKIKRIYLGDKMLPRIYQSNVVGSVYSGDFEPSDISGLVGWWDASDVATVTTVGSDVSQIDDKSGLGRHATQITANNRPTYSETINGRNVMTMNGTSDFLITGLESATLTGYTTMFCVAQLSSSLTTTTAGNKTPLFGRDPNTANSYGFVFNNAVAGFGLNFQWRNSGYNYANPPPAAIGLPLLLVGGSKSTGRVRRVNGISSFYSVATPAGTNSATDNYLHIGLDPTQNRYWNDLWGEALVFDRELTEVEIQKIEGYLAWKWGLQEQLPYDHPYASSFPGFGSQTLPSDPDALAYLSSVASADGTGVEVGVAKVIEDFIVGCKSDGIWDSIKASCILAGARTLNGALVPLAGTAPTNNNFVNADYDRKTGLIGDGATKYLDSNRAMDADPLNDQHVTVYASAVIGGLACHIGANQAGSSNETGITQADPQFSADLYFKSRSNAIVLAPNSGLASRFIGLSRTSGLNFNYRINNTNNVAEIASSDSVTINIFVFARGRNSNTADTYSDARLSFYSIGEALDLEKLDNRFSRFMAENKFFLNTGLSGKDYDIDTLNYINAGYENGGSIG